ncbi:MAG: hypothetical protein VB026_05030, partial [Anaerolineaceae bacterium]|nr:hypothetical protein [Anaerolineaceae bacterium]
EEASALWQEAASEGSLEAFLELAKYYEHHNRDYPAALACTIQALTLCSTELQAAQLNHRRNRLEKKLSSRNNDSL